MKFRSIYLSAALALALAGCGAGKIKADPIAIKTPIVAKKGKLAEDQEKRWSHLDIVKDTVPGMSVDRALELLKKRKSTKVIVGVVDSGVDIEHPDLKAIIWTNKDEIAGNGKDDDNNGYIDDIHGWNFLGDAEHENLEFVRILKKGDDGSALYKRAKAEYDKEWKDNQANKQQVEFIANIDKKIRKELKKENYTAEDLRKLKSSDQMINAVKPQLLEILGQMSKEEFDKEIEGGLEHVQNQIDYNLNLKFDGRKAVGDNPDDLNDRVYGNNNVTGPVKEGALHGTHVAGIIAQGRNNGIGGDGVASNHVEIMPVRAVPDGDEYDKDIALAIRYAVDNGAKVINGSFGKYFSTHSDWVYDAIRYAASKDVLIVCAAGNESYDLNEGGKTKERYPNDNMLSANEISNSFLTVGAISYNLNEELIADFSNYGRQEVDVFSPGVRIYATIPDNGYKFEQGTSMASPNTAGVAALIRSYYPNLTAAEVKNIIMESGVPVSMMVNLGGDPDNQRNFAELSRTGKIVNAYNAIILADKMSRAKK